MAVALIADVGGTHARFALADTGLAAPPRPATFPSASVPGVSDAIDRFLGASAGSAGALRPDVMVLAVAGPVRDGRCQTTNLPWVVDEAELAARYGVPVRVINDFEAVARGMPRVADGELASIAPGARLPGEVVAILGAGTGLGEALLVPFGDQLRVVSSEGGHADFAPWDTRSDRVLVRLREKYQGHVSMERVASGMALPDLFDIVRTEGWAEALPGTLAALAQDAGRAIGEATDDPAASMALAIFARALGAEAGNLALKSLPRGGVRLAGGIVPKLLASRPEHFLSPFLAGYLEKGRMRHLLEEIPVDAVLADDVGLRGALAVALGFWRV